MSQGLSHNFSRWLWLPVLFTGLTRAYGIAAWPLAGDEGFTLVDSTSRFSWDNLRVLPFAFNHFVTVPLLGETELSLRVGSLVAAVLATAFLGWGLARLYSTRVGLFAAWLTAASPALLIHGQLARYYMQSCLLGAVVLVALRLGLEHRRWLLVCLVALIAGWFTVPSTVFIVPGLVLWGLFNRSAVWEALGRPSRRTVIGVAVVLAGVAVAAGAYVLLRYPTGPAHGVRYFSIQRIPIQIISLFGVPATLLFLGGFWIAWRSGERYLTLVAAGSVAALLAVFPFIGVAPSHFVSVSAPLFGLGGLLLAQVWDSGRAGQLAAVILLLVGAKQFGSHFVDGSRVDFRAAAEQLDQVAPGAPVATTEALNLGFYARDREVRPIAVTDGRLNAEWAVVPERRAGLEVSADVAAALQGCAMTHRFYRPRFDHRVNALQIYRCSP